MRIKLSTMAIKRDGDVMWHVSGDHHCGPKEFLKDGQMPVRYSMTAVCEPKLDKRGFLFDQAAVDKWMKRIATEDTTLSCEALAVAVAERFLAKIERDTPHCKIVGLRLTLSPAPHLASITVRYGRTVD